MTTRRARGGAAACVILVTSALLVVGCGGGDNSTITRLPTPTAKPPGAEFSLTVALELSRLGLQAYQALGDFNDGTTFTLPAPYTLVQELFTNEHFEGDVSVGSAVPIAFVATRDTNVYVVFRGTKTIAEWILDAQIGQVPYSFVVNGGMTEQGFTRVYESIHAKLVQTVNTVASAGSFTQLYVTGHSLGGALALLAVPELIDNTPFKQPIMYSFAGPFTGNARFANLYDSLVGDSWRVVNTNDVVPKLPKSPVVIITPTPAIFFYEPVSTEYAITFGMPITDPLDITGIANNHSLCNYYNTLCGQTTDPPTCMAMAGGADGCNATP